MAESSSETGSGSGVDDVLVEIAESLPEEVTGYVSALELLSSSWCPSISYDGKAIASSSSSSFS